MAPPPARQKCAKRNQRKVSGRVHVPTLTDGVWLVVLPVGVVANVAGIQHEVSLHSGCSKLLALRISSLRKPHDDGISERKAPTLALIGRSAKMPCKFDPTGSNTPLPAIECSNKSESPFEGKFVCRTLSGSNLAATVPRRDSGYPRSPRSFSLLAPEVVSGDRTHLLGTLRGLVDVATTETSDGRPRLAWRDHRKG